MALKTVHVKTGARLTSVRLEPDGSLLVRVRARPEKGKANEEVRRAVAKFFDLPFSRVQIVSGSRGKTKVITL